VIYDYYDADGNLVDVMRQQIITKIRFHTAGLLETGIARAEPLMPKKPLPQFVAPMQAS
jgi:hypothetical protein